MTPTVPAAVSGQGRDEGAGVGALADLPSGSVVINVLCGTAPLAASRIGDMWALTGYTHHLSTRKLLTFDGDWRVVHTPEASS